MRPVRSLAMTTLFATALMLTGVRRTAAQDAPPPDLKMLLNLDLFASHPRDGSAAQNPNMNDSMLEQIRTLDALGYLGATSVTPGNSGAGNAGDAGAIPDHPRQGPGVQQ